MTQHIEEARVLMNKLHSVVSDDDKLEVVAALISLEAIFAAALAAAEERGRIEERERSASKTAGGTIKPLFATRFKLSFDRKARCTTFRKDQAEKLEGQWVWLIEATNGMNEALEGQS